MPRYGHAQTLGFSEDVQAALGKERAALGKAGVDADVVLGQIAEMHERVATLNARQESLKRELRETTVGYVAALRALYVLCSGALDIAMAAVRKDSPAAQNLRRLRSAITRARPSPAAISEQPGTPSHP